MGALKQGILKLLRPDFSLEQLFAQWCEILGLQHMLLLHHKWDGWEVLSTFYVPSAPAQLAYKQDFVFRVEDTKYQLWVGADQVLSTTLQAALRADGQHLCEMIFYHLRQLASPVAAISSTLPSDLMKNERSLLKNPPSLGLCYMAQHQVQFMNAHLCALFALDVDLQSTSLHVDDFLARVSAQFEQPETFWQMYRLHEKTDEAFSGQLYLKDGRAILWDYIPVVKDGAVNTAFWVFRDITPQIKSRIEKEILARFPQENPNPLMRIDPEGNVLYANRQAEFLLLYWEKEERDVSAELHQKVKQSLASNRSVLLNVGMAGRTWQVMLVPVLAYNYVNFYGMDITERLLAEQRALQARDLAVSSSEAKSQFLATMSHEIRTPLNAILGMLDVLHDTEMTEIQRSYVETSQQAGERLMGLISNLLDFSRIEAGQVTLDNQAFQLRSLIQETLAIFQLRAKDKGITLQTCGVEQMPEWLKGDRRRLSQILFILLDNALKFTAAGRITVRFSDFSWQGPVGILKGQVEDTGIGVPPEKQAVIFEAFSQADSSTTRKYGGTGLGLSIARQLVLLFDGELKVQNNAQGGATFSFQLCLEKPLPEDIQAQEQEKPVYAVDTFNHKWGERSLTLLVAEDSLENRLLIQAYLKGTPFQLIFAENGQEALDRCAEALPDFILMDVQMPVMDGLTAIAKLRERNVNVPIVVLSADVLTQTRKKAFAAGGNLFLTKPIHRSQLLHILDQCLTNRSVEYPMLDRPTVQIVKPKPPQTDHDMPAFERIEELFSLLPVFFSVRHEEARLFETALQHKDAEQIRRLGHRLRGASTVYGFPYFSEIGGALEDAAKTENWSEIEHWLQRFNAYLDWTYAQLQPELDLLVD